MTGCVKWPAFGAFILILLAAAVDGGQAQPVFTTPGHPVYQYLDRLEAGGKLATRLLSTRPLTRAEIATALVSVDEQRLNAVELELYRWYAFEFQEGVAGRVGGENDSRLERLIEHSLVDPWLPDYFYANRRNMLSARSESFSLFWDPVIGRRAFRSKSPDGKDQTLRTVSNGFRIWGTLLDRIGLYLDVRDTKEWGGGPYPNRRNYTRPGLGFVRGGGDHEYHDETVAYITCNWKNFTLLFGKDVNWWGPGYRGQLALSAHPTSYDMVKLQFVHPKVKFTSLVGFLKNYNAGYFYGDAEEKQIAAHRVEFAPFSFLEIGLHETVVFSGRKFEPGYYNPFMFYRSAEHYLGDSDNAAMGLDAEIKPAAGIKLYGELFIDDITTSRLGSGFYGNKYAYTAGACWANALVNNLDLRMEFSRTRPYLYSHKNPLNTYSHFGTVLGHFIGPNSENLFFQAEYRINGRLLVAGSFERIRHGANTPSVNYGGDFLVPHSTETDPENVETLAGSRQSWKSVTAILRYEVFRNMLLELRYSESSGDMTLLNSYLSEFAGSGSQLVVQFGFNY